jgi:hypothetical protein
MTQSTDRQVASYAPPLKHGATSFGSFYPTNYVLAVFRRDALVGLMSGALSDAGFPEDDIIVAAGEDVAEYDVASHERQGLLAKLGEKWSRLYTDDAANADELMDLARAGASFVLVYAPDEAETALAAQTLRPLAPLVLRKYEPLASKELE